MIQNLQLTIQAEMTKALKNGDSQRKAALSFLLAGLKDFAKTKKVDVLSDADAINALQKQLRQVQETLEATKDGSHPDAHGQAQYEIDLIGTFLPVAPSDDEVKSVVAAVIAELHATSMRDMGKVIAEATFRLPGADKAALSKVAKPLLSS